MLLCTNMEKKTSHKQYPNPHACSGIRVLHLATLSHSKKMTGMNLPVSPRRMGACNALRGNRNRIGNLSAHLALVSLYVNLQDNSRWSNRRKDILKKDGVHCFQFHNILPFQQLLPFCHFHQLVLVDHPSSSRVVWIFIERIENTSRVAAHSKLLKFFAFWGKPTWQHCGSTSRFQFPIKGSSQGFSWCRQDSLRLHQQQSPGWQQGGELRQQIG